MTHQQVPLLLAHPLLPETTPSGTTAALSQSPCLYVFFLVFKQAFVYPGVLWTVMDQTVALDTLEGMNNSRHRVLNPDN